MMKSRGEFPGLLLIPCTMKKEARKSPSSVPHSSLPTYMRPVPPIHGPSLSLLRITSVWSDHLGCIQRAYSIRFNRITGRAPPPLATRDDEVVARNGCLGLPRFVVSGLRSERNAPLLQLTPASNCCFCLLPCSWKTRQRQKKGKSVWSLPLRDPAFAVSGSPATSSFRERKKRHRRILHRRRRGRDSQETPSAV
ncbi:hypothetical protein J3F84DRAFT_157598 [Trichoderma pleuroticola]